MIELKPCPKCGYDIFFQFDERIISLFCAGKHVLLHAIYPDLMPIKSVIENWNEEITKFENKND